jgi:hydroxymethylbilane synthase
MPALKIGTRGSQLAVYQATTVASLLHDRAAVDVELLTIKTSGDRLADATLAEIGGKRLFVKEIEEALLAGTIDLAVHSSKDMSAIPPDGLEVAAVLPREDPRDALVLPAATSNSAPTERPQTSFDTVVASLGTAPRIGTSSVRRIAQLVPLFPHARFVPIRGNLDTRLRKLDAGEFDAIVLASAGLRRLGFGDRITVSLPPDCCVPAPGQGIIAIQIRSADARTRTLVAGLNDHASMAALDAERAIVRRLGGGCQMPIGAFAVTERDTMRVAGVVITLDGSRALRAEVHGQLTDATALGAQVGDRLLAQGAAEILSAVERAHAPVEGLQP